MPERGELRRKGLDRIEVTLVKGTCLLFSPAVLDKLLEHNCVKQFKRKSGWITVGVHPIRTASRRVSFSSIDGPDRRASH